METRVFMFVFMDYERALKYIKVEIKSRKV